MIPKVSDLFPERHDFPDAPAWKLAAICWEVRRLRRENAKLKEELEGMKRAFDQYVLEGNRMG